MPLLSAVQSDIGRVRRENEDRTLHDETLRIFGVADGIGGLPAGAEAAQLAVDRTLVALRQRPPDSLIALARLIREVNQQVALRGRRLSPATGIGTTLTVGWFRDEVIWLAHVGDSRCYRLSSTVGLQLLTEDHSVENELRRRRATADEIACHESQLNALTRCIGQPDALEVDVSEHPLVPGDLFLFATDGITRMIDDVEIAEMLAVAKPLSQRLEVLLAEANRRGGPDNATAVLVAVAPRP